MGDKFNVFNIGEALIDPDTGAKLGASEKQTATGAVVEVQDKFAVIQLQRQGRSERHRPQAVACAACGCRTLGGPRRGDELIFSGPRVRIGRSRDNTLILTESDAPSSSGRHAEAVCEGGAWWVVDSGLTNGTYVNGARIQRQRLAPGDRLALGEDQFVVAPDGRSMWLAAAAAVVLVALVAGVTYATRRRTPIAAEQVASAAVRSVYAVVLESGGTRSIVGTAFAVDGGLLATNAHVADAVARAAQDVARRRQPSEAAQDGARQPSDGAHEATQRLQPSAVALAIRGDTFDVSRIVGVTLHPDWKPGSIRADAALLRVQGGAPVVPLTVADGSAFLRLRRGTPVMAFGFPAVSTDAQRPRGRLSMDIVGDVRGEVRGGRSRDCTRHERQPGVR